MTKTKVFLDTNVFKFSATELLRARPREVTINWGKEQHLTVYDPVTVNPNEKLPKESATLRADKLLEKRNAGLKVVPIVSIKVAAAAPAKTKKKNA